MVMNSIMIWRGPLRETRSTESDVDALLCDAADCDLCGYGALLQSCGEAMSGLPD